MSRVSAAPANVELIDGAFDLLRQAPASAWLWWASGSLPYAVALLGLVAEATGPAHAASGLFLRAFVVAAAYLWTGCSQVVFCSSLRAILAADSAPRPALAQVIRSCALVHASALMVLPLALLSLVGAPWVIAFYQSACAFPRVGARATFRYAAGEASRWSTANLLAVLTLAALALVMLINVVVLFMSAPMLVRMLTGQDSVFARTPVAMLNMTVATAALLVTWLLVDPLLKAVYTIRCFRADSVRTGADLKAQLKRFATTAATLSIIVVAVCGPAYAVAPADLDRAIAEVTKRPEYQWSRLELVTPELKNPFVQFTEDAARWVGHSVSTVVRWIGSALEAVFGGSPAPPFAGGSISRGSLQLLMAALLVVSAGIAVWFVLQRARARAPEPRDADAGPPVIDITREDVTPDQLPDDEWISLAEEWTRRGDLRMASRAVFLALLAGLGERGAISIHKAKSNADYLRELMSRTRGDSILHDGFRSCIRAFERTWYGGHDMSGEAFAAFRHQALNTRSCARQS